MPANITELDAWTTPVVIPVAGEEIRANDWTQAAGALANRTNYARNRVLGIASSYTKDIKLVSLVTSDVGVKFEFTISGGPGGNAYGFEQTTITAAAAYFPFDLPRGDGLAKLTGCRIYFRPPGSHGALPATQPSLTIVRQGSDGGSAPTIVGGPTSLGSGSVVAYENPQNISISGLTHTISNGDRYFLAFGGEMGANALAGLLVTKAEFTVAPL
jgi:hypothetical protein